NEALRREDSTPLAELGLGRDPLNAALDGAQDALAEMTLALAHTVLHPIRTLEDLGQLPTTVAYLIATSPEYFARYGAMSREDQIREAARLSTHLVLMLGGARATVGRMGGLGSEVPVLSLTARGELVLGGAMVASTAGMDLGALSILHMAGKGQGNNTSGASGKAGKASQTAPARGPGKWTYKKPTTESKQALDYQEQVTGRPAWYVYMVGEVEFDGFTGTALLEAKGGSYKNFLTKDGMAQPWFEAGKGFKELVEQARRQSQAARTLNVPVVWHVAEAQFAAFLRKLFTRNGWKNITVHHTPAA
ncbi:Tox-REase-5 domain-containing protein, partial [Archangium violaceum]|uniref:Tox-REase-5 domain-containing protein n=1 Tax=Archangium violaceum TaxID=83451 RepID=UPI001F39ECC7